MCKISTIFTTYKYNYTNTLTINQVNDVMAISRVVSAPAGILPKETVHLNKVRNNDPLASENCGFVSYVFIKKFMYYII